MYSLSPVKRDGLTFSRSDLVDIIFGVLEFDKGRPGRIFEAIFYPGKLGHSVQSVLVVLRDMRIIKTYPSAVPPGAWTEDVVRRVIRNLISTGQLNMNVDGVLLLPPEERDAPVERFMGSYYATDEEGHIHGPFAKEEEALQCLA